MLDNWETDFLTVPEGWYLATSAGAAYFAEQPGFAPGNHLHALVLADDDLPQPHPMTPQERLERAVYLRQGGAIRAVWSEGRKVFSAEVDQRAGCCVSRSFCSRLGGPPGEWYGPAYP